MQRIWLIKYKKYKTIDPVVVEKACEHHLCFQKLLFLASSTWFDLICRVLCTLTSTRSSWLLAPFWITIIKTIRFFHVFFFLIHSYQIVLSFDLRLDLHHLYCLDDQIVLTLLIFRKNNLYGYLRKWTIPFVEIQYKGSWHTWLF